MISASRKQAGLVPRIMVPVRGFHAKRTQKRRIVENSLDHRKGETLSLHGRFNP